MYNNKSTKISRSNLNKILLRQRKICLRLSFENDLKDPIFNLQNIYYLLNSPYNLIYLRLIINSNIFYKNKYKNTYQITSKKVLI